MFMTWNDRIFKMHFFSKPLFCFFISLSFFHLCVDSVAFIWDHGSDFRTGTEFCLQHRQKLGYYSPSGRAETAMSLIYSCRFTVK